MAEKKRTRMYEPWGYQEENNYQGDVIIMENDLDGFFSDAQYKDEDKSIHFYNKDGEEKATLDVTQFAPSVVESAVYDKSTKILTITFSNGDKVEINLAELIDENEFADGLVVNDGIVKVLIDSTGEPYLSVGDNGVKISGVDQAIADAVDAEKTRAEAAEQALQDAIDAEKTRATAAEQTLDAKIDQEIADRTSDVDAEETRAKAEEASLSRRTDSLNDELDAEKTIREAADVALGNRIDQEIARAEQAESELQAAIEDEGQRAQDAEVALDEKIDAETNRAISAETELAEAIDAEVERALSAETAIVGLIDTHAGNDEIHITEEERTTWNAKADKTEIPTDFYTQEEVNVLISQLLTRIELLEEKASIVVADTAAEVAAAPAGSDIVLVSTDAIQALTANTEYNTLTIVGGSANNGDIKAIASDKLTVDGVAINGDKGASNGRIQVSANTVDIKNVTIEGGSTAYNVFEGSQNTTKSEYFTTSYNVSNLTADNVDLNHNIINIYTPADNAVINIKNCNLNLDVDNSNLLRMANYTNATGVTINFENVEWTYENAPASDWKWAGLMIFQPSSSDVAVNGDTSKIETWTVNVKNCKYNGEKVTANNFGEHNQVVYLYNINKTSAVTDADAVMTINFE